MTKDTTITFRLPRVVKRAMEQAARRDLRSIGQYTLKVLVEDLIRKGELREEEGHLALRRAPRTRKA